MYYFSSSLNELYLEAGNQEVAVRLCFQRVAINYFVVASVVYKYSTGQKFVFLILLENDWSHAQLSWKLQNWF